MSYDPNTIGYKDGDTLHQRRNALRFLIDDRQPDEERYTDAELNAWLVEWASVWQAAATLADKEIGAGVTEEDVGSAVRIRYLRKMAPEWRSRACSHQKPIVENIDSLQQDFPTNPFRL